MNWLPKKCLFSYLRFLNVYILSLVLILNRENLDGEPGNNCYDILKFWPILSLVILIKRILIKKRWNHSFCFRHWVKVIVHIQHFDLNGKDICTRYEMRDVRGWQNQVVPSEHLKSFVLSFFFMHWMVEFRW